jgi:hypothetical protein
VWSCGALCAQEDEYRFNRGWLLNAGIAAARLTDGCDYFALHDIDVGLSLTPGCHVGYMEYTGCHQVNRVSNRCRRQEKIASITKSEKHAADAILDTSLTSQAYILKSNAVRSVQPYPRLLPVDPRLPYGAPPKEAPVHLSPPGIHPEYMYPSFKGGSWLLTWRGCTSRIIQLPHSLVSTRLQQPLHL